MKNSKYLGIIGGISSIFFALHSILSLFEYAPSASFNWAFITPQQLLFCCIAALGGLLGILGGLISEKKRIIGGIIMIISAAASVLSIMGVFASALFIIGSVEAFKKTGQRNLNIRGYIKNEHREGSWICGLIYLPILSGIFIIMDIQIILIRSSLNLPYSADLEFICSMFTIITFALGFFLTWIYYTYFKYKKNKPGKETNHCMRRSKFLGIIGGISSIFCAIIYILVDFVTAPSASFDLSLITPQGFLFFCIAILGGLFGILGGLISGKKRIIGGIIMIISAAANILSVMGIFASAIFIIGSVQAFKKTGKQNLNIQERIKNKSREGSWIYSLISLPIFAGIYIIQYIEIILIRSSLNLPNSRDLNFICFMFTIFTFTIGYLLAWIYYSHYKNKKDEPFKES